MCKHVGYDLLAFLDISALFLAKLAFAVPHGSAGFAAFFWPDANPVSVDFFGGFLGWRGMTGVEVFPLAKKTHLEACKRPMKPPSTREWALNAVRRPPWSPPPVHQPRRR